MCTKFFSSVRMRLFVRSVLISSGLLLAACNTTASVTEGSSSSSLPITPEVVHEIASGSMLADSFQEWQTYHNGQIDQRTLCDAQTEANEAGMKRIWMSEAQVVLQILCTRGAYQSGYVFYKVDNPGADEVITQLFFDTPFDQGGALSWVEAPLAMEASYNGETNTLTTLSKDRGLGDCGSSARFEWENTEEQGGHFVLKEYRSKTECDGSMDSWPLVYPQGGSVVSTTTGSVTGTASGATVTE